MVAAQKEETRADAAQKEWNFHNLVGGSKDQVTAQFGRNSNQAQSVGRKKPSEYKPRTRGSKKDSGDDSGSK